MDQDCCAFVYHIQKAHVVLHAQGDGDILVEKDGHEIERLKQERRIDPNELALIHANEGGEFGAHPCTRLDSERDFELGCHQ